MLQRIVILGVGSNIDPLLNLRSCLREIKKLDRVKVISVSKIYESDAMLKENSPDDWNKQYLNAAVKIEVENFDPKLFLAQIKSVEHKLNRESLGPWSPRTIDIDILFVENLEFQSDELIIPHKDLEHRPFALLPLLDVYSGYKIKNCDWMQSEKKPFNTKKSERYVWPQIVGILNLTTDSFSDGGHFVNQNGLLKNDLFQKSIESQINAGADVLDIGAESTRPGAAAIDEATELNRLTEALKSIQEFQSTQKLKIKISIDCRKYQVMHKIIDQFAIDYINDVEGFRDPNMISLLKNTSAHAVCMHSMRVPPLKEEHIPLEQDSFDFLTQWWNLKLNDFEKHKISSQRLIFDLGIGFGKTPKQSFELLENLSRFHGIKQDVYIGHSRKSFLTLKTNAPASDRDVETAQVSQSINQAYCQFLRVHNVQTNKKALL